MNTRGGGLRLMAAAMLVALLSSLVPGASPALAVSPDVVISQVYGGGGNSGGIFKQDFVELFNRGAGAVSLNGWSIQYTSASGSGNFGSATYLLTELPNVSLQPGQYFLVQEAAGASTSQPNLPSPDFVDSSPINMSGTGGKVALVRSATGLGCNGGSTPCSPAALALIVDLVGWDGANFFETAAAPVTTNSTAILRGGGGCNDSDNNASDFSTGTPAPRNTSTSTHACDNPRAVGSTVAAFPGQTALLTVTVTAGTNPASAWLAAKVNLTAIGGAAAQMMYDDGSNGDAAASDNVFSFLTTVPLGTAPAVFTLPVTITDDQARTGTAVIGLIVRAPIVPIHVVQGAGHISPLAGHFASVQGVVTAIRSTGFYVQDLHPDADDATSEGVFVFASGATVAVGDEVIVSGTPTEYRPGASGLTVTEFDAPGMVVTVVGSGRPLPAPVIIGLGGRIPPGQIIENDASNVETDGVFDPAEDGIDFWESMEGMLVQLNGAVAVGPTAVQYGELPVVGDSASVRTPRGGVVVRPGDFNPERVVLDDEVIKPAPMPAVSVGTSLGNVVGVLDYNFGNFMIQVTAQPTTSGSLDREITAARKPYELSVAAFNVENLSPKDPPAKFSTLAGLIVTNLKAPDLLAIEEIQDNDGISNTGVVAADATYNMLISAISAAGGPTYQVQQIDPVNNQDGGAPGGNIRVAFLFRTDTGLSFAAAPAGDPLTPVAVTGSGAGAHLTLNPGRVDPTNSAFASSRKPLAGEFMYKGNKLFVVANHWNSKGGDEPLMGFHQPPTFSSETQRAQQATVVHGFVESLLAADPAANIVVLGDLNDFQFSAPVLTLADGVLHDLVNTLPENERYTYVFEGNSEVLDHILIGNSTFARPFAYDVVHVNSEFPDQTSDHEPQVARLCLDAAPPTLIVKPSVTELWPANHQYIDVNVALTATDSMDPSPAWELISVTSNEPDNGLGDGDTPNDIVKVTSTTFKLRAERSGTGSGRIYSFTYRAKDGCGNVVTTTAVVTVPRDKGK